MKAYYDITKLSLNWKTNMYSTEIKYPVYYFIACFGHLAYFC